jgi:homoserine O-succinyltransferase
MFGVFEHRTLMPTERLLRGFDDTFLAPHSRHIEIRRADIEKVSDIQILSESDDAGVSSLARKTDVISSLPAIPNMIRSPSKANTTVT